MCVQTKADGNDEGRTRRQQFGKFVVSESATHLADRCSLYMQRLETMTEQAQAAEAAIQ